MGGGTTIIEGLRLGVKMVGVDLNPVAWLVTKTGCEIGTLDRSEIDDAFRENKKKVSTHNQQYYKTECPLCLAKKKTIEESLVDILCVFWQKSAKCTCGYEVPLLYT